MAGDDDDRQLQARRKANLRLALILASIVVVFFLGFVFKTAVLSR